MKKPEIIKVMLAHYIQREIEILYPQYIKSFESKDLYFCSTISKEIGQSFFDESVIDLDDSLFFREGFDEEFEKTEFTENDIALALLDLPSNLPDRLKDLLFYEKNSFLDAAYDLIYEYHQNKH